MYGCHIGTVICRQCIRVNQNFYQTLRIIHHNTNHYETLNLKPNCTAKDIRDSFIKLSKENHPDTSASKNSRENVNNFRNIMEAYRVLGRADSRAIYDTVINHNGESTIYTAAKPNPDTTNYYGVFGSKKISNKKIVLFCVIFMIVGVIVQALAIRFSITFRRENLDKISTEAGKVHSRARANAMEHGNDYQINMLIQKSNDGK